LCALLVFYLFLVAPVEVSQEALEVALMLGCCLMVGLLELGVADEGFAVLAPVFGL
jgi:hypothetical protein